MLPTTAHNIERVSRYAVHSMICTIHNEFDSFCNRAKLSDNQFIAKKFIVVRNMVFKLFCSVYIIIVSIFTHNNIWPCDHILNIYNLLYVFVWIYMIRIWSHNITLSNSDLMN